MLDLKYLFEAEFEDGSIFEQPLDNRHPEKYDESATYNPSAFTYVQENEDKIVKFSLVGDGHRYSVDLITGAFSVDGNEFYIHDQFDYPENNDLQLIYFRETVKQFDQTHTVQEDGSVSSEESETRHFVNRFFIGWKYYKPGKDGNDVKVERTLAVA